MNSLILSFAVALCAAPSFAQVPAGIPQRWQQPFAAAYAQLDANLRAPDKKYPFYHVHPAPKYPGVYLWDSAFISLIWLQKNSYVAQDVIRSVLVNQQPDGRVPHVVTFFGTSKWTQPPVLTWAAARIFKYTRDLKFAREIYKPMKRFHEWLMKSRQLPNGLFFWDHPYESGIDNAPRFGMRDESYYFDTHKIASTDISSYIVMDAEALTELAQALKNSSQDASERAALDADIATYQAQATRIGQLVRQILWDEKTGYFYDRNVETNQLIGTATIASLFPLTAGIADANQAKRLIAHIADPKGFNTRIPFPTVARGDRYFEKDMWRGPVWINTAYLALQGLKRYGEIALMHDMASRLVDGVYLTWAYTGKFLEFYDPERYDTVELSRKKGLGPLGLSASHDLGAVLSHLIMKQLFLGTKPVDHFMGWTGLVNALILEENLTPPAVTLISMPTRQKLIE